MSILCVINNNIFKFKISKTCKIENVLNSLNLNDDYELKILGDFRPYHTINAYIHNIVIKLKTITTINYTLLNLEILKNKISSINDIPINGFDLIQNGNNINIISTRFDSGLIIKCMCKNINCLRYNKKINIFKNYCVADLVRDKYCCKLCNDRLDILGFTINNSLINIVLKEVHEIEQTKHKKVYYPYEIIFGIGDFKRFEYYTISCKSLNYENNICGVCFNNIEHKIITCCGHSFCKKCIEIFTKCPVCFEKLCKKVRFLC
jgi:hypothetical protein